MILFDIKGKKGENLLMKKILIFGATGNIGIYFTDYCLSHLDPTKFEVIAVGRKKTDYFKNHGIRYIQLDLTNEDDFSKLPVDDVYAIVNMAGLLPAYTSKINYFDYVNVNITGSLRILEYARKVHADRTAYMQTWAEMAGYWGKKEVLSPDLERKIIYTGDHAFYTITKSTVVEMMKHYQEEFGIKSFVFRLPNIYMYSPVKYYYVDGIKKSIAYRYMIDRAAQGLDIEMWGDPNAFKDIIYVKDFCQMVYKSLFAVVENGLYCAGTGIKTTLKEQIEGMVKVFSPADHPSKIVEKPEKPSFVSFVMDIENARKELGYEPEFDYISYLKDYKKEMKLNRFAELWGNADE